MFLGLVGKSLWGQFQKALFAKVVGDAQVKCASSILYKPQMVPKVNLGPVLGWCSVEDVNEGLRKIGGGSISADQATLVPEELSFGKKLFNGTAIGLSTAISGALIQMGLHFLTQGVLGSAQ